MIKAFKIYGLFGVYDVNIPFDEKVKILIGENGLGKTQVLNILYHTLAGNIFKLYDFNFDFLEIRFNNGVTFRLSRNDINKTLNSLHKHTSVGHLINKIGLGAFDFYRKKYLENNDINFISSIDNDNERRLVQKVSIAFDFIKKSEAEFPILLEHSKLITENIKYNNLLYFPTYRLIEENLHNLGISQDKFKTSMIPTVIQFGMSDVTERFRSVEKRIDQMLKDGLTEFTNDILKVVISPPSSKSKFTDRVILIDELEMMLSRVGDELPNSQKDAVRDIIINKRPLDPIPAYLLQKLFEIYDKQKEIDDSIKKFRDICNSYLIDKKVIYNESKIKIYIESTVTHESLPLSHLSSGEKQLLSIFSKIYLSDRGNKFMVFVDEPELSLGLKWQRKLLADIVASGKCEFLLAATHSPFIFDNELDQYAVGLSEYISTNTPVNV